MQTIRSAPAGSPRARIPTVAVPAAPIPVHTAYAVPTGRSRRARFKRAKLAIAQTAKSTVGTGLVKPSLASSETANPVSSRPALIRNIQAILLPSAVSPAREPPAGQGRDHIRSTDPGARAPPRTMGPATSGL